MKKFIVALLLSCFMLGNMACGDNKILCRAVETKKVCKEYQTYGFFSMDDKDPSVHYSVVGQNVFWSILFSESIVIPILILGLDMYEPEGFVSDDISR